MMKLQSIAKEAAACRAAWAGSTATSAWHRGHASLIDPAVGWADRIHDILTMKPKHERALRLRLFRPASPEASKAIAPAQAAYDKAIASAQAAYDKAIASAQTAFDKAIAPAWAAYDKAIAPARTAYDKAIAPARTAFDKAIASAHLLECPDCPWDGQSIFPNV